MNFDEFKHSLASEHPPPILSLELKALWYEGKSDWETSHQIAQDIETPTGAWIHAYLHRKEGDQWNADYWYTRAGKKSPNVSLQQEWEDISRYLLQHQ